jgi:O-antigen/teichoic acid export membrane protein
MAGSGLVSAVLTAVGGVITGRLVDPATLGLFRGITLVLVYVSILKLGVSSGLNRELPYFIGRGDRSRAEDLAAVAQAWALAVGGIVFAALLGISGWQLVQGNLREAAGWFTCALMALMLFYTDYLQVTYRTAHDFATVAVTRVVEQVALVILLALVVPLDFYGLCFRVTITGALSATLLFRRRPVRVRPRWNWDHLKYLLKIGLPIFVVWQIFDYWEVIDQTLVLRLGGTRMMGLYSMAILVMGAVGTLPGALNQVLYPRMSQQYGGGQSLREVGYGLAKPLVVTAVAVAPVLLIAWWVVEPATRFLMPQYVDAVPAIQWVLPVCFVRCFEPGYSIFSVGRRQGLRLVGVVTGMAAYGGSLRWLARDGVYLAAFPQAMLIGRSVCVLVSYALIHHMLSTERGLPGSSA